MPSDYRGTAVPFEQLALPDLCGPVLQGPGHGSLADTADVYRSIAEDLQRIAQDLRAVMTASQSAHEGEAADASRQHIGRVASVGEAGAEQARLAMQALQEQASYFSSTRNDMQAAADAVAGDPKIFGIELIRGIEDGARTIAVDAAHRYQDNSNYNLANVFQPFDHPDVPTPDVTIAATSQSAGFGNAQGVGPVSAAMPHAGPVAPGGTPAPPTASPGVGSTSIPVGTFPVAPAPTGTGNQPNAPTPSGRAATLPPSTPGASSSPRESTKSSPTTPGVTPARFVPAEQDQRAGKSPPADTPGWAPGQPWTSRTANTPMAPGLGAGARLADGSGGDGRVPERGATHGVEARSTTGRPSSSLTNDPIPQGSSSARTTSGSGTPFMPMSGAGGRGQDTAHPRPPWLVEEDPEAVWLSGLPPHGPAVIEPLEE
jgi:hypothetical protein